MTLIARFKKGVYFNPGGGLKYASGDTIALDELKAIMRPDSFALLMSERRLSFIELIEEPFDFTIDQSVILSAMDKIMP